MPIADLITLIFVGVFAVFLSIVGISLICGRRDFRELSRGIRFPCGSFFMICAVVMLAICAYGIITGTPPSMILLSILSGS